MTAILLRTNEYVIKTVDRVPFVFPPNSSLISTPLGPYSEKEETSLHPANANSFFDREQLFTKRQTLDVDPLFTLMVSTSSFFNVIAPRISRVRCVDLRYLQILEQSPTFCYALELHLNLRIPKNEPIEPLLDAPTQLALSGNCTNNKSIQELGAAYRRYVFVRETQEYALDFLQRIFPRMDQVESFSFSYPSPSESNFFKDRNHLVRGGAGGFTSCFTNATNHSHRVPSNCQSFASRVPHNATTTSKTLPPHHSSPSRKGDDGDDQEEGKQNIFELLALLPNLRHLSFHGLSFFIDAQASTPEYPSKVKNFNKILKTSLPQRIRSLDFTDNDPSAEFLVSVLPSFSRLENFFASPSQEWSKAAATRVFEILSKHLVTLDLSGLGLIPQEALVPLLECSKLESLRLERIRNMDVVFMRNLVSRLSLQGCRFRELRLGNAAEFTTDENDPGSAERKQSQAALVARNKEDDKHFLDDFATSTSDGAVDPCPLLPVLNRSAATIEVLSVSHLNLLIPPETDVSNFPSFDRLRILQLHNLEINEKGAHLMGSGLRNVEVIRLISAMKTGTAGKIFIDSMLSRSLSSSSSLPPPPLVSLEIRNLNSGFGSIDISCLRQTLEQLSLGQLEISDETIESIRGFPYLNNVNLFAKDGPDNDEDEDVRAPDSLTDDNGTTNKKRTFQRMTDKSLEVLSTLPSLKRLRLGNGVFSDAGFAHLGKICNLSALDFAPMRKSDAVLTEEAFRSFFASPAIAENLDTISLRFLPSQITTLPGLGGLKRLQVINVTFSEGINNEFGRELAKSRSLKSIVLRSCPQFAKMGIIYMMEDADKIYLKEKHEFDTIYGLDVRSTRNAAAVASNSSSSMASLSPPERPLDKLRRVHVVRCGDFLNPIRDPRVFPHHSESKMMKDETKGEGVEALNDNEEEDYGTLCPDPEAEKSLRTFPATVDLLKIRVKQWRPQASTVFFM